MRKIHKIFKLIIFIFGFSLLKLSSADKEITFKDLISFEFYQNVNFEPNEICSQHLNAVKEGLNKREEWALQLIDSWGKIPSGIMKGNFINFGNFDQCLQVISDEKIENDYLKGKYCTAVLPLKNFIPVSQSLNEINLLREVPVMVLGINNKLKQNESASKNISEIVNNIKLQIGVCLPKVCEPEFVDGVMKKFLKDTLGIDLNETEVVLDSANCGKHPDDIQYEQIDYIAITFFSLIAAMMIFSSIYDLVMQHLNKKGQILLTSFSILSNGKKLFAPSLPNSDNIIGCLNGIRCLSMLWVIFGHSYAFGAALPFINMFDIVEWKSSVFAQVIFNANICVDSFFFLSGFLVAWMGFKELHKSKGKLNIPLMYFHRYIRLTPVIGATILFLLSVFKFFGNGPYWHLISTYSHDHCTKYWWTTLLYIFNYVNPHEPCLLHTWYLDVDTQLYLLSPLLLIPTYRWGRKFLYPVGAVVCILSIGCCFATHVIYNFPMIRVEGTGEKDLYTSKIYYATHTRASPWVIGFVLGYFMFTHKSKRFVIPKIFNFAAWLMSVSIILAIVFGPYSRYQNGDVATTLEAAFYESFKRFSWAVALSWIVFSCQKGYGGIINSFLSYSFWTVLGRLTYCMYICHMFVLMLNFGRLKTNMYFKDYDYQLTIWGHFGLTVFVSIIATLAFELPILQMEKVIFGTKRKNADSKKSESNTDLYGLKKNNLLFPGQSLDLSLLSSIEQYLIKSKNLIRNHNKHDYNNAFIENNFNNIEESLVLFYNKTLCDLHLKEIENQVRNSIVNGQIPEFWILQLFDSWGKLPAGLLSGHMRELGQFDQCLKIEHIFKEKNLGMFKGQYCTGSIPLELIKEALNIDLEMASKTGLQVGFCLPSTCEPQILNDLWISILKLITGKQNINGTLVSECVTNEHVKFTVADYVALVIFTFVGLPMVSSTIYDYFRRKYKRKPNSLLISFSIISNGEKLFKISTTKSPNTIDCLNGIRCITIVWIVLGHSYMTFFNSNLVNGLDALDWMKSFFALFMVFGTVSVDTFLFLSGLLLTWTAFREMEKSKGKLNIIIMYVHRYLRLTPALAAAVLFCVSFVKYIGNGPFWQQTVKKSLIQSCERNWWVTLLYIQNYKLEGGICLPQTWYLGVDTQLYFLSPLLLIPLWKWGRKMIIPLIFLALLSIACIFTIFMKYDFSTIKSKTGWMSDNSFELTYVPTHTRYAPWLIGFLVGYFLFENKNKKFKMSKIMASIAWMLSIGILLSIVIAPFNRVREGGGYPTKVESASYAAFSRTSWTIALSYIVFACHKGYGGIINDFLSWPFWQPFSRITYSIYIVHLAFQYVIAGNTKHDQYFSNFSVIYKFWGDFGFTLSIALLLALGFECPIIEIEKIIFKRESTVVLNGKNNIGHNQNCNNTRETP
ncbi:uncharacterized protein LOC129605191 [Condylostylus longicornis]|uniref:uncharacterized protein LOC129605191 n=1 Tax=Condylostylus longicornis TaxID=2530218 RepID=UPI00244DF86F|nr:uncharacterized protein LOC129605191 [Condylostylus longicornis]